MLIKQFSVLWAVLSSLVLTMPTSSVAQTSPEVSKAHKVIAYYFHGNVRCPTCKAIEAYTKEALETGFPAQLKEGSLELKVINIDEAENEHFVNDFQLITRSVVLVDFVDGKQSQWKTLNAVWTHVRKKTAFIAYVQQEVTSYLGKSE